MNSNNNIEKYLSHPKIDVAFFQVITDSPDDDKVPIAAAALLHQIAEHLVPDGKKLTVQLNAQVHDIEEAHVLDEAPDVSEGDPAVIPELPMSVLPKDTLSELPSKVKDDIMALTVYEGAQKTPDTHVLPNPKFDTHAPIAVPPDSYDKDIATLLEAIEIAKRLRAQQYN